MKINQGITFALLIWNLLVFMIYGIDKSKADATAEQGYLFTSTGIVVQYEELPWQKSVVLTDEEKIRFQEGHLRGSERYLTQIWDYLSKNKDNDFL